MVMVYVPFGEARQPRHVREVGTMKRIVMWLMVAALMAALMGATAVAALTAVGPKNEENCGEGPTQSDSASADPRFGLGIKQTIDDLQEQNSSEGESIRVNASHCEEGV